MRYRESPAAGFTLLEMVIALAIFAVAASIVYGLYAAMVASVSRVELNQQRTLRVAVAFERLRLDLLGLYREKQGYLVARRPESAGEEPFLEFLSTAHLGFDPQEVPGPLSRISYFISADGTGGRTLSRIETPLVSEGFSVSLAGRRVILLDGLDAASLRFNAQTESNDSWDSFSGGETERDSDSRFPADLTFAVTVAHDGGDGEESSAATIYLRPSRSFKEGR